MQTEYTIDLTNVTDKKTLHALIAQTLHFPAYYGRNLDALYDMLTQSSKKITVHFTNCAQAQNALGQYFTAFIETFLDAQNNGANISITQDN